MTAVFCDLVNSVGLSVELDPEELMHVLERYHTRCDDIVTDRGGFLAQFMGDGVLAYFGYPHAQEDGAASAVRAGLDILAAVQEMDADARFSMQVRIGIASGLVMVSDRISRANKRTVEITGKIPNLAARLQSAAQPGTIVIPDETHRIIRGLFSYRDLGGLSLKGFAQPVRAWEVIEPDNAVSRFQARLHGQPTPFVGREHEIGRLAQAWRKTLQGQGQVIQILGDAGMGKSRLTEHFEHELIGDSGLKIRWFCSPQHEDSAFYPITQQVERAASINGGATPSVRIEKLTSLLSNPEPPDATTLAIFAGLLSIPFDGPTPLDGVTPEKRKELTMATLLAQPVKLSAAEPVLLIVEDTHWIDASTLELLSLVIEKVRELRVLVIITARAEFRPHWTDKSFVSTIALSRLDAAGADEICAHVSAGTLPPDLAQQVIERSDGIPFYVEELTRAVVEAREMGREDATEGNVGAAVIPLSLHDSLVARLDRLGAARQIANIGAVIGREFAYDLLATLAPVPEEALRSALGRLKRSGVVNQSGAPPNSKYLFRHALMRDAAYDSMIKVDRQKLHRQVATALESHFPEVRDNQPEVLAYHLSHTEARGDAVPHWQKAGQRAAERAAHQEAIGHYQAALELIRAAPPDIAGVQQELLCLLHLAVSLSAWHGYAAEEVREVLTRAREICTHMGDAAPLFPVLHGMAKFWMVRGDEVAAEELARSCVKIGEETGYAPYIVEANATLAYILQVTGQLGEELSSRLEQAIRVYEVNEETCRIILSEANSKTSVLILTPIAAYLRGHPDASDRYARQALEWAQSLKRPFDLAITLTFLANYAIWRRNYGQARRWAEEAIQISETYGFGVWLLSARAHRAIALGYLGHIEEARTLMVETLAAWKKAGCHALVGFFTSELAYFQAEAGHPEEARRLADEAITLIIQHHDFSYLPGAHLVRARVLARAPRPDIACVQAALREALSVARSQGLVALEDEILREMEAHARSDDLVAD